MDYNFVHFNRLIHRLIYHFLLIRYHLEEINVLNQILLKEMKCLFVAMSYRNELSQAIDFDSLLRRYIKHRKFSRETRECREYLENSNKLTDNPDNIRSASLRNIDHLIEFTVHTHIHTQARI